MNTPPCNPIIVTSTSYSAKPGDLEASRPATRITVRCPECSHPITITLAETLELRSPAEMYFGNPTDIVIPKRKEVSDE